MQYPLPKTPLILRSVHSKHSQNVRFPRGQIENNALTSGFEEVCAFIDGQKEEDKVPILVLDDKGMTRTAPLCVMSPSGGTVDRLDKQWQCIGALFLADLGSAAGVSGNGNSF